MTRIKFTAGEIARGKAQQQMIEKRRKQFVANDSKPKVDIRDYFLAAALQGLCANPAYNNLSKQDYKEWIVKTASAIADEVMLHGR